MRSDGGGRGPRGWVSCLGLGMRALQCGVLECHCPGRIGGSPSKGQRGGVDGGRGSWLICVDRYVQSHTMARSNDLLSTLLSSLPPFHPSPSHCTSSCSRHVASVAEQMTTTEPLWLNDDCGRKQTWSLTGKRCSSREQGGGGDDCMGGYGHSLFLCTVRIKGVCPHRKVHSLCKQSRALAPLNSSFIEVQYWILLFILPLSGPHFHLQYVLQSRCILRNVCQDHNLRACSDKVVVVIGDGSLASPS